MPALLPYARAGRPDAATNKGAERLWRGDGALQARLVDLHNNQKTRAIIALHRQAVRGTLMVSWIPTRQLSYGLPVLIGIAVFSR